MITTTTNTNNNTHTRTHSLIIEAITIADNWWEGYPDDHKDCDFDFRWAGVRVPALLISAYLPSGQVSPYLPSTLSVSLTSVSTLNPRPHLSLNPQPLKPRPRTLLSLSLNPHPHPHPHPYAAGSYDLRAQLYTRFAQTCF